MLQNTVDFKAKSFLTERNTSTMAYEVKAVRALWDPSLSIPGTNRRGGWRCPVGTRYGGQITDRFGRSCGWGIARRIANQISDIGSRLENVDDARRGRRIARRERRILARLNPQDARAGRLERGLRGVAERLDGGETSTPSGRRRRTVTARPPSVDAPEAISEPTPDAPRPPSRRRAPARPVREEGNLLAGEPTEVLEEMRAELENATGGRDSDDYKRVMAELKRRESPARPARRRQPARRRGGNLRESEQRRMDREIEEPGAPRTGEAPARRRRRAVVEATNNPKAPAKKPEAVVEPKIVKPRRPKPKENTEQRIEGLIEEEAEISRRIRDRMLIDIGNPPKDFIQIGNGHWRKGDWFITRDQEDDRVLGLSASHPRKRGLIQARNFDELVRKIEIADRLPSQPPPAPQPRRRNARQEVNLNRVAGDQSFMEVLRDEYIPNDRIMIVNDARNFPQDPREKDKKVQAARRSMKQAEEYLRKINTAIARGEISDRDFVRMTMDSNAGPEEFSVARVKEIIEGYRDGWNEIRMANQKPPANAPQPPKPQPLNSARGIPRDVDLANLLGQADFARLMSTRIIPGVDPQNPNNILNNPSNNPQSTQARFEMARMALEQSRVADRLGASLDALIPQTVTLNDTFKIAGRDVPVSEVLSKLARFSNDWLEIRRRNRGDAPVAPATAPVPAAPNAPAVDPIDAAFIAPDRKNIKDAPPELRPSPVMQPTKEFTDAEKRLYEQLLQNIPLPENLGRISAEIDGIRASENEAVRALHVKYQTLMNSAASEIERNPQRSADGLINDAQRQLFKYLSKKGIYDKDNRVLSLGTDAESTTERLTKAREALRIVESQIAEIQNSLRNQPNLTHSKKREELSNIRKLATSRGQLSSVIELVGSIETEQRKLQNARREGYQFTPDSSSFPQPTTQEVNDKIKADVDKAIDRRAGKLDKYLQERYPNGGAPYEDMTPEKWREMSTRQKNDYLKVAYSHPMIKGANGKFYRATATSTAIGPNSEISVIFDEIDANGNVLRSQIGTSRRTLSGYTVTQNSFFIDNPIDKGNDIQTIYNQHAFLFLSKMGVTRAYVGAASDGTYVWARVGFKRDRPLGAPEMDKFNEPLKYYERFGPGGLISTDEEYARIKNLQKQAREGRSIFHQEAIFAIKDVQDEARRNYIKQWFVSNIPSAGGILSFDAERIGGVARNKPPKAPTRRRNNPPPQGIF